MSHGCSGQNRNSKSQASSNNSLNFTKVSLRLCGPQSSQSIPKLDPKNDEEVSCEQIESASHETEEETTLESPEQCENGSQIAVDEIEEVTTPEQCENDSQIAVHEAEENTSPKQCENGSQIAVHEAEEKTSLEQCENDAQMAVHETEKKTSLKQCENDSQIAIHKTEEENSFGKSEHDLQITVDETEKKTSLEKPENELLSTVHESEEEMSFGESENELQVTVYDTEDETNLEKIENEPEKDNIDDENAKTDLGEIKPGKGLQIYFERINKFCKMADQEGRMIDAHLTKFPSNPEIIPEIKPKNHKLSFIDDFPYSTTIRQHIPACLQSKTKEDYSNFPNDFCKCRSSVPRCEGATCTPNCCNCGFQTRAIKDRCRQFCLTGESIVIEKFKEEKIERVSDVNKVVVRTEPIRKCVFLRNSLPKWIGRN